MKRKRTLRTFKDWYEDNKEELSKRRKDRYRMDPTFRAITKSRARRYYREKVRLERGEETGS